ncbi:MAG TPA: hypothetical protein VK249_33725 [Anaerolineales bacterium]|nr:hypothetical protein [Anaerolineales bacterium]
MLTYALQEAIDASTDDILDFLERDIRSIHPYKQKLEGAEITVHIQGVRTGNIIAVYARTSTSEGRGDEMIRFEVVRHTKTSSMVKAFYECDNPHSILMFHRIWARLAIAFRADFAGEALRKLNKIEKQKKTG